MTVLAAIAALAAATCVGYYLGRRAGSTPPPWKRTSRMELGRLAISMVVLLTARRVRRRLRAEPLLRDPVHLWGMRFIAPLELLRGGVARARSW